MKTTDPIRLSVGGALLLAMIGGCGGGSNGGGAGHGGAGGGQAGGAGGTGASAGTGGGAGGRGGDAGSGGNTGIAGAGGDAGDGGVAGSAAGTGGASAGTTGTAGTSGTAGSGGRGGAGGGTVGGGGMSGAGGSACTAATGAPAILSVGQTGHLLLRGTIVTPSQVLPAGEVLVDGDTITCVATSCASAAGANLATVIQTNGIVFPGLIDTHNHVLYDIFDATDWSPSMAYANHNQWTTEPRYKALVDAKQYLNGEGGSTVDLGCEIDKYGEIKALIAGTTSIVTEATPANRACFGTLARTIDQTRNGLGADKIQTATVFPTVSSADGVCSNLADDTTDAYLIHIADGVDQTARNEFAKLGTVTTAPGCLYAPETAIVVGTALGDAELTMMAARNMSLIWSPRSNVFLYGAGSDLGKTANIPLARAKGINVALGPDWSIGGSQNLLDELRYARTVDQTNWGGGLSSRDLALMVTANAARALGLQAILGALEVGKKADIMVIGGDSCAPYDALIAARPADVRLVLVGGVALYGEPALQSIGPASPGCEHMTVCGRDKFICVAAASQSTTDKLEQTFSTISASIESALETYDSMQLTQFTFAPITPIVTCP